ncbi:MAG: L-seryl-tRNA(Sec) selenium transferase [Dehalococcoidia bacterium]
MSSQSSEFRRLPSVESLLSDLSELRADAGDQAAAIAREVLIEKRAEIAAGASAPSRDALLVEIAARARRFTVGSLRPVINATGVIIHTNLGRAPLAADAAEAARLISSGYSTLEYDLDAGARGLRDRHVEDMLCQITGAEAALAVNNNAAALLLALSALAAGREGLISRGQAVEIGGGFRIPDVMRQSGVRLIEVGTTNRTYLRDYEDACTDQTAVLLRVHSSNFAIAGFTHAVDIADLAALGERAGVCVVDDLGSGCLLDTRRFGLAAEPTVQASVAAGVGVVCFSGDKLLGGPQAGLIVGQRRYLDRLRRHPLARAVRIDKSTLAALLATLRHYLRGDAETKLPVWQMISLPLSTIERRAVEWATALGGETAVGRSAVGGGSLPGQTLATRLVLLPDAESASSLAERLRRGDPAVVSRVEDGRVALDPRTVLPGEDVSLIAAVRMALGAVQS